MPFMGSPRDGEPVNLALAVVMVVIVEVSTYCWFPQKWSESEEDN